MARQGQPGGGVRQRHLLKSALAGSAQTLGQNRLEHGFAGHQGAAHVGKQGGGQVQAGDQAVVGQVGQVMARFFGAQAGRADDGDQIQGRMPFVQRFPAQAELGQRRRAEGREQHVRGGQHLVQRDLAFVGLEVDGDDPDPVVQRRVGLAVVLAHRVARRAGWHARGGGRLGFGTGGTHGAQAHQRRGARQVQRQAEHAHPAQGFERSRGGGKGVRCGGHGVSRYYEINSWLCPADAGQCRIYLKKRPAEGPTGGLRSAGSVPRRLGRRQAL